MDNMIRQISEIRSTHEPRYVKNLMYVHSDRMWTKQFVGIPDMMFGHVTIKTCTTGSATVHWWFVDLVKKSVIARAQQLWYVNHGY